MAPSVRPLSMTSSRMKSIRPHRQHGPDRTLTSDRCAHGYLTIVRPPQASPPCAPWPAIRARQSPRRPACSTDTSSPPVAFCRACLRYPSAENGCMNAQHSPGTPASNTRYRARRALHLLVLGLSATGLQAAAQEQTEAVWKEQEISVQYRSFNASYSCSSLQQRDVSILRAVGARDELEVTLQECYGHFMSDFMSDDPMDARRADPSDTWRSPSSRSWNDPTWSSSTDRFNRRSRREQSVQVRARVKTPTE